MKEYGILNSLKIKKLIICPPVNHFVVVRVLTGSPNKSKGRTFRAVFKLPTRKKRLKTGKSRPQRLYRNPIYLAREWQKAFESGDCSSKADLARKMGVSRARVTQIFRLLTLAPEVVETIAALGDPLTSPIMTERKLRHILKLPKAEQTRRLKVILG